MKFESIFLLGSLAAIRPVFWMVMGVFLLLYVWRLAKRSTPWTGRLMVAGALLLACGYTLVLPMYEAGLIERYSPTRQHDHGPAGAVLAWHIIKMVVMNLGWLAFGVGMALHAKLLRLPVRRQLEVVPAQPVSSTHELAA